MTAAENSGKNRRNEGGNEAGTGRGKAEDKDQNSGIENTSNDDGSSGGSATTKVKQGKNKKSENAEMVAEGRGRAAIGKADNELVKEYTGDGNNDEAKLEGWATVGMSMGTHETGLDNLGKTSEKRQGAEQAARVAEEMSLIVARTNEILGASARAKKESDEAKETLVAGINSGSELKKKNGEGYGVMSSLSQAIKTGFASVKIKKEAVVEAERINNGGNNGGTHGSVGKEGVKKSNEFPNNQTYSNEEKGMEVSRTGKRKTIDWAQSDSDDEMEVVQTMEDNEVEELDDRKNEVEDDKNSRESTNYYGVLNNEEVLQFVPSQVRKIQTTADSLTDKATQRFVEGSLDNILKARKEMRSTNDQANNSEIEVENQVTATDEASVDTSEASYSGDWKKVGEGKGNTNEEHSNTAGKASTDNNSQSKLANEKTRNKTSFECELPKHERVGGKPVPKNKSHTKKILSQSEVEERSAREPKEISRNLQMDDKHLYRVQFDLNTTKATTYVAILQVLFNQMCTHDPECCIKSYLPDEPANDITKGMKLSDQCWNAKRFKLYFANTWDTSNRAGINGGQYQINGKMRLETKLSFDELKGRMLTWLQVNKFYIRKPYIQEAKVSQIGFFLGSSLAQWRNDTKTQLEEAIKVSTGKHIRLDVQKTAKKFQKKDGTAGQVGLLTVSVQTEKIEEAEEGFLKVLANGVVSPVGRRMTYVPTRDRSRRSLTRINRAYIRQHELNREEKSTSTDLIKDLYAVVTTINGKQLTLQQVLCSLKDSTGNVLFTGAERLGDSGRVLLTFQSFMEKQAREVTYDIVPALQAVVLAEDHESIADEQKIASRETLERQRQLMQDYLDESQAEWYDGDEESEEGSVSTLSVESEGSSTTTKSGVSVASSVTLDSAWKCPVRRKTQSSSTHVVSDAESDGSRSTSTNAWSRRASRQRTQTEQGGTTQGKEGNSILKTLQDQLNDIKMKSDKEVNECNSQIKKAAEQQQVEMEKIRSDQRDLTETLKMMTSTLQMSQTHLSAQQKQLTLQQKQIGDIRGLQEAQLRMMGSILTALNPGEASPLRTTQTEVSNLISQVTQTVIEQGLHRHGDTNSRSQNNGEEASIQQDEMGIEAPGEQDEDATDGRGSGTASMSDNQRYHSPRQEDGL